MDVQALLERIGEHTSVGRAFGPAYEHDGVMVIPAALIVGGGGGGHQPANAAAEGGGFGGVVHPLGVYTVQRDRVRFVPTYEATVLTLAGLSLLRQVVNRRRARARS